ncbi:MAG TPA: 30S ribosomal protein S27ae [Nitrososphaeraceae archaeon]|jgi:ubiquitin-small subunit ribosomal protein S27Ae|nr:30S ribosomal protein S27ae [Nitrososphaeraceae archaeon]
MADKKSTSKGEVSVYKFYTVKDDKITRSKRDCPRCGKGVFMAEHKDRHTCGKCGFTEFAHKEQSKKVNKKQ